MLGRVLVLSVGVLVAGYAVTGLSNRAEADVPISSVTRNVPEARTVLFGELHVHTTYSFDAWSVFGSRTSPDQAYKFGRGESVEYKGHPVSRAWPLDFMAVTDHAEYLGVFNRLDNPNGSFAHTDLGKRILQNPKIGPDIVEKAIDAHAPASSIDPQANMKESWEREIDAANNNYEPGKFTTFIAYEWTSMPQNLYNLHRNVIFRTASAPLPFTSANSKRPEDLWTYLEAARRSGYDVLAISHNSNVSGGLMFDWNNSDGQPIDAGYAQRRAVNEPLVEIYQLKGQSETTPQLSSADEFSDFQIYDRLLTMPSVKSAADGSYVRQAYGRGVVIQNKVGVNPFKMGVVGGTDIHNGLSTQDENAYAGGPYGIDPRTDLPDGDAAKHALELIAPPMLSDGNVLDENAGDNTTMDDRIQHSKDITAYGSGGLTGVWAEENTRDSIFAALQRKETFATSGPRIRVRFFGGWSFDAATFKRKDWVKSAYATGVPMGGDLPTKPVEAKTATFIVESVKAPDSGNLDRIQIIKVWLEGSSYMEKVFDVVLSGHRRRASTGKFPPVGNTVDAKTGTYTNNIGATQLRTVWKDPSFDPTKPAVYYVRVIEIPTPRWTTLLAVKRQLPLPRNREPFIQERAWTSPIWYTPATQKQ